VRADLEKELEEGVEHMRQEMQRKIAEDREAWTEERIECWKLQSEQELAELAAEHNELQGRKQSMDAALNLKRLEKQQAEQRWEAVTEKNALIANLRAELKELKKLRA
jgi:hypothetical protein